MGTFIDHIRGMHAPSQPTFPRCRSVRVESAPHWCSRQALAHRKQRRARAEPISRAGDRRLAEFAPVSVDHGRTYAVRVPSSIPVPQQPSCFHESSRQALRPKEVMRRAPRCFSAARQPRTVASRLPTSDLGRPSPVVMLTRGRRRHVRNGLRLSRSIRERISANSARGPLRPAGTRRSSRGERFGPRTLTSFSRSL
jgi:hypothetical protein